MLVRAACSLRSHESIFSRENALAVGRSCDVCNVRDLSPLRVDTLLLQRAHVLMTDQNACALKEATSDMLNCDMLNQQFLWVANSLTNLISLALYRKFQNLSFHCNFWTL